MRVTALGYRTLQTARCKFACTYAIVQKEISVSELVQVGVAVSSAAASRTPCCRVGSAARRPGAAAAAPGHHDRPASSRRATVFPRVAFRFARGGGIHAALPRRSTAGAAAGSAGPPEESARTTVTVTAQPATPLTAASDAARACPSYPTMIMIIAGGAS